ncbi:NADP-dependent 3-hydroxy acid dehydrogenase YdfG [Streptoalloteichus tenebrarius]|uniref:NADP-dependent 3-hydroxy acid dehydrogenase YdfG n=1 Tax=Streptoalloteichus tenebrarius (strain ATCC 17920 / DSM 40477 / JCM 4838 / CBS 697.72 / NBRC 16177 / NCIMB 11028 / NRRL B-12390 / A12253. 1 / ISP 5477) TaxID=1933 RepID=A0ABT1HQI5_STRSD|nr:SDR family oxidoreductase [Streptoalloteichus tenebrarius]MCP2257784.1 NADP-dependent 3-hydroxy acid dehydrogenase YdfG [Streptoalloteichus tenebrarius]BFE99856.1 SDR family oxidoreductase [Streptoalloteichus tenebrarius]
MAHNTSSTVAAHTGTGSPLAGRVAVVTGASSGIGAAVASRLAADGARVALLARRADRLSALAEEIAAAGGEALPVAVDVTDADQVSAAAETVAARLGRVDLVVNNAGVALPSMIDKGRTDDWQRMIDLNVTGVLRVVHAFVPALLAAAEAGAPADLVNISSVSADVIYPGWAVYAATKAAVTQFSATLRAELGGRGVRVTNIEPGMVDSELRENVSDPEAKAALDEFAEAVPSLEAGDLADVLAFLVSRPSRVNLPKLRIMPTWQA